MQRKCLLATILLTPRQLEAHPNPSYHECMDTFDFIIVGAGSAGCVLANRLTASGRHTVLLLEAGGTDKRFFVQMPLGYGKTFMDPKVNWMYATTPDPGLNGQRDHWPRGKILGGSSSINAMVYIRGHREDYENWKSAGNPGWGWEDVLKSYIEMELGGLRTTNPEDQVHPLTEQYIKAAGKLGLAHNTDFNAETQEGVGVYHLTAHKGQRMSAARAFLDPARTRKNLKIITNALVSKVIMKDQRAVGIQANINGLQTELRARHEVILAGGAVNSPQLLQLSGIGPAERLQQHGIPLRIDNPNVGEHLEDHLGINYTYRMKVPTLNDQLRPWWGKLKVGLRYLLQRSGPLSLSINHGGGFFRTDESYTRPNMQLYFQAFSTLLPKAGERPILSPDPFSGMSIGLSNCRPQARGSIHIASPDPTTHPTIWANAFGTDHDVREMLAAVKFIRRIAAQDPLASLIAEELRPGPHVRSDEDLIHDIKQRSGTVYHPCCTARMGPDPKTSVVDARLRVHGAEGLRVCDASIFPNIITGNTNAPAMMVGWKGAEIILADHAH